MQEERSVFPFSLPARMKRRTFLKASASVGLSAAAFEAWLAGSGTALAESPGMTGYWPLNEGSGSSTLDASGNGNIGQVNGATWTTGRLGKGLSFNGSSNTVNINKPVVETSASFSVAAWVQLSNLSGWHTAVSQDGSNVSGFFLQFTSGGQFAFSLVNSDSTSAATVRATSTFNPVVTTWYHLVGVYDNGSKQISLYANGALQSTQTVPAAWNATGQTVIGRAKWGGSVDFWPGAIDEVRLYNYALNAAAVTALYQGAQDDLTAGLVGYWPLDDASGSSAADLSGSGHNGTLTNGPVWTTGKLGAALTFNGSNSTLDINQSVLNTSNSFSAAAWVQLADLNGWHSAVSQDGSNVSGFFLQFTSGGQFAFSLVNSDSTSGTTTRAVSNFNAVANTWYHLVGVYDASAKQGSLYVNGVLQSTVSVPAAWNASGETVIGRAKWGGAVDFWPGKLDDVRLYNRALSAADATNLYQLAPAFSPIRPAAVPLIVRGPYVNTWQFSDTAPGTWSSFWNGSTKAITGIARIDGTSYTFFGAPPTSIVSQQMTQTQLEVTPTQSRYVFQAGGVTLYLTFLSPVEATDVQRLSMPLGYLTAQVQSNDGKSHTVNLYFDISGEWAHGTDSTLINWQEQQVAHSGGNLTALTVTPSSPTVLAETSDYPSWGQAVWATNTQSNLSYQSGADTTIRAQFVSQGTLNNSMDTNMPRAINNNWPVFAFDFALGTVTGATSSPLVLALGHVRQPAVSYQGNQIPPLWQSYWSNWQQMLGFFYDDASAAVGRANALDASITSAAVSAGGVHYASLCAVATRQAFGGVELVNTTAAPWMFLKEISSDGNVSTIDVVYPSFPIFYYLNPTLLSLLIAPILAYAESGLWPKTFCLHDLGSSYPNASGHNDGGGENMPVEESANMLIMAAAYVQQAGSNAASFSNAHYKILKQWADYLNAPNGGSPSRPNALDPLLQNQTDDFTGSIAHSTNLALKGIIAIGAMSIIAKAAGNSSDQQFYTNTASSLIGQWAQLGQDSSQAHLDIAYNESDTASGTGPGTYSLKYNGFSDKVLGLGLVPSTVSSEEAAWYQGLENEYGIPLDSRHTYTKADWEMWTAAATDTAALRQFLIDALYRFYNTSPSRVPSTDWYDTITDTQNGFQARPVVGGFFALLARIKSGH
jgi:hypothetical protein